MEQLQVAMTKINKCYKNWHKRHQQEDYWNRAFIFDWLKRTKSVIKLFFNVKTLDKNSPFMLKVYN